MKTLRFVAAYSRGYVKYMVIAVLAMLGLVGVQLLAPGIVRTLVGLVQELNWEDAAARTSVTRLALFLLVIYVARVGFRFLANYMSHSAGWGVVADARRDIYQHLQRLSLSFYEEQQTGQLMSRMINDSEMFERLISHAIPDTLVSISDAGRGVGRAAFHEPHPDAADAGACAADPASPCRASTATCGQPFGSGSRSWQS